MVQEDVKVVEGKKRSVGKGVAVKKGKLREHKQMREASRGC